MSTSKREPCWLYTLARGVFSAAFCTVFPLVRHHVERVNIQPPFILISNHKSLLDPMAVGIPVKGYNVRFLGKKELVSSPIGKWVMKQLKLIPVDRHNSDLNAMRQCVKTLRDGQILGIFPEGTRHQPELMHEIESGTAVLALRAKVPLIPAYIDGKIRFLHRTHVYFGEPIDISDLYEKGIDSETVSEVTERIRSVYMTMRDSAKAAKEA